MNAPTIELQDEGRRGRYVLETENGAAELTYFIDEANRMVIEHTYVPSAARGRKVALHLVERAVADAKQLGRKIVPQCPYVARVFDQRADWADLRAS